MTNFEYFELEYYKSIFIKHGKRIDQLEEYNKMLSLENHRLKTENMRLREQLELLELKKRGFIGKSRGINIMCRKDINEGNEVLN